MMDEIAVSLAMKIASSKPSQCTSVFTVNLCSSLLRLAGGGGLVAGMFGSRRWNLEIHPRGCLPTSTLFPDEGLC